MLDARKQGTPIVIAGDVETSIMIRVPPKRF
jgi:hypothetical protein